MTGLHGYESALTVKKAYTAAVKELDPQPAEREEGDGKEVESEESGIWQGLSVEKIVVEIEQMFC